MYEVVSENDAGYIRYISLQNKSHHVPTIFLLLYNLSSVVTLYAAVHLSEFYQAMLLMSVISWNG